MRVHHLNCGTLRPLGGRLIDGKPGFARQAEMICHCLLVETPTGLVLVETGVGSPVVDRAREWLGTAFCAVVNPARERAETAVAQVERLGYRPADVRHVVLTHLDLDHAGGLVDFPDATVHVYATELEALRSPKTRRERTLYRGGQFAHGPKFQSYQVGGEPWFGFTAVRELDGVDAEIVLVPLAGHTRGHAGVAVNTGSGWLLNAGDAYFHHGELTGSAQMPVGLRLFESLVQHEREARLANQRRLRDLIVAHGNEVTVFCAHDPVELRRLATATSDAGTPEQSG